MASVTLSCKDVTVSFGAYVAIDQVSLDIEKGKIYSIIGPNGAGKTTLINVFSGLQNVDHGKVFLEDEEITSLGPHARAMKGIGRSFQIVNIFPAMTVFENLRLAGQPHSFRVQPLWRSVRGYGELKRKAMEMLDFIGLTRLGNVIASTLSHGDQRRLEIGISLMNEPRVLMLDEPTAGVGHHELESTVALIAEAAKGRTVILIEHNMDIVMKVSDKIFVLVTGKVLCGGTPGEIQSDSRVREAYLGIEEEDNALT